MKKLLNNRQKALVTYQEETLNIYLRTKHNPSRKLLLASFHVKAKLIFVQTLITDLVFLLCVANIRVKQILSA